MTQRTQRLRTLKGKLSYGISMIMGKLHQGGQEKLVVETQEDDIHTLQLWQSYGLEVHVPDGGKALTLLPRDTNDEGAVLLVQSIDSAPTLEKGEVALWNTKGAVIKLKADGSIEITGDVVIKGDITAENITATGDIRAGQISLTSHIHTTPQGPTGVPQ